MPNDLDPIAQKWKGFLAKVSTRVDEVVAEAGPGLDDLIGSEVIDPVPLSAALSELKARFYGLRQKVDDSWRKIEAEIDQVIDADGADVAALTRGRGELQALGDALNQRIDDEYQRLEVEKSAHAARSLYAVVEQEMEKPNGGRKCSACGAPIVPPTLTEPSNVSCEFCKAHNTVRPGIATAMFFQGGALHALAVEAAAEQAKALAAAEKRFKDFRQPTEQDAETYRKALVAYWRAYAEAKAKWVPGSTPAQVEREATGKIGQAWHYTERDRPVWQRMSKTMAMAQAGNRAGLQTWLDDEGADTNTGLDELLGCAHEHKLAKALELLLTMAYEAEDPGDPFGEWKREKLSDLER